jgi:hypothetical protein
LSHADKTLVFLDGKAAANEGHGFSRAAIGLTLDGFSR